MSKNRHLRYATLTASCLAAAVAGHLLSSQTRLGTLLSTNEKLPRGISRPARPNLLPAGKEPTGPAAHQERNPEELARLKEDLCSRFAENHQPGFDFILRSQTASILATLSPEELGAFLAEIRTRDPSGGYSPSMPERWETALSREILRQWGLKDPIAAIVAENSPGFPANAGVFNEWLRRERAAAEKWLMSEDGEHPLLRKRLLEALVRNRAAENFTEAGVLLGKLDPKARHATLETWSRTLSNDADTRQKVLALVDASGDDALKETCYGNMVASIATRSPEEAANFLENSPLPEEAKDRMMDRLIQSWANKNPGEAFQWWISLKESTVRPGLVGAMKNWYFKDREASVQWIDTLEPGPVRSTFEEQAVSHLANFDDFQLAAKVAGNITDDASRIRQYKILRRIWEEESKDGAAAWLRSLSEKDRNAVME